MTTYSFNILHENRYGSGMWEVRDLDFEVVMPDKISAFTYVAGSNQSQILPMELTLYDDAYNIVLDGAPLDQELDTPDNTYVLHYQQSGASGHMLQIIDLVTDEGDRQENYYLRLEGDVLLTQTGTYGERIAPITINLAGTSSGYAPGDPVVLSGIPGVQITEDDRIIGTETPDVLHGGLGHDLIKGLGRADTLTGGTGKDRLLGGNGQDVLRGEGGADTLRGGNGNDLLRGGKQSDRLFGEDGDDQVFGGAGRDYVTGGRDDDTIDGGADDDVIYGGAGADILNGGLNGDNLYGNRGADRLWGDNGHDYLSGGQGNDRLNGGDGNDRLSGDKGNDRLVGGDGADRFQFVFSNALPAPQVVPTDIKNTGHDVIVDFTTASQAADHDRLVFINYPGGSPDFAGFRSACTQVGDDVFFDRLGDGDNTILLRDVDLTDLTSEHVDFLISQYIS